MRYSCLENDYHQEEILFVTTPELVVAMALCSYLHDEEALQVRGALTYSRHTGFAASFKFAGPTAATRTSPQRDRAPERTVCAMDGLQGAKMVQFGRGLVARDFDKARVALDGAARGSGVATGNWACGAFGNEHELKVRRFCGAQDLLLEKVN